MSTTTHLAAFRKELHQHPEVSGQERETAQRIIHFLEKLNPQELITSLGGTGVLATFGGKEAEPEILLRCELDALPIQEINTFAHASQSRGVSHKCGHDGHMAVLCGVAEWLSQQKNLHGKVHLLFQPAEENGEGAKAVLADSRFQLSPDWVFAFHNLPGYPLGQVVYREGTFTAAVNSLIFRFTGKTSHAAEPEHGINPAFAIAEILQKLDSLSLNDPSNVDMRVISVVHVSVGEEAYGISAGAGELHLTLRCWDDERLRKLENDVKALVHEVAKAQKNQVETSETQTFFANTNDAQAAQLVEKACVEKALDSYKRPYPFKWGEDFGLFTNQFRGCMFGIGAGEDCPALHNPDYDFPDAIIPVGVQAFTGIIQTLQKAHV
ncbi:amidohydrolase [Cytophagales bacterium LB-30]|uniref:Amidohydrolase n=1 Tax=Shiella aurantiaca TaxID=3058365 RepID=A0ABT8F6S6_9BACT|nr:amidohydrolase [Shiella aurantiaca]MDN4166088.1 amidohydrolase [Shiella aurantiaca]